METTADNTSPSNITLELGDGRIFSSSLLISSWNISGLKAILFKDHLINYMKERNPDILCLLETKLNDHQIDKEGTKWIPEGYTAYFNCCKVIKGYSGSAILTKYKPMSVQFGIGIEKHDQEGRVITLEFEAFFLVTCYLPNSGAKLEKLEYRTKEWEPDFRSYVNELKKKKSVVICGDFNCSHQEIDVHNPKISQKIAGFANEERKCFEELLSSGFVDTFRHLNPETVKYSFFSLRFNCRDSNKGWRLDYFLVDKDGLSSIMDSLINEKIYGSDHLPIELVLDPSFSKYED